MSIAGTYPWMAPEVSSLCFNIFEFSFDQQCDRGERFFFFFERLVQLNLIKMVFSLKQYFHVFLFLHV